MNKHHSKSTAYLFGLFTLLSFSAEALAAEFNARLQWERRVELSTPVQGVIIEVPARAGQRVQQGQVLVQLDDRGFRADVDEAESRVKSLGAIRDEARRDSERALELYDRTVLSDHELQVSKNNAKQAESDYVAARAALVQAKLNLEYSAVRAPFDALVIDVSAEKGQTVINELQPTKLVTVADASSMIARVELKQEQVQKLEVGQEATVRVGDRVHVGRIKSIGLEPIGSDDLYLVMVSFALEQARYRVGQTATVELP